MRIIDEIQLDFDDVLIAPQRSTLNSRSEVEPWRGFKNLIGTHSFDCIPITAANMGTVGTVKMAKILSANGYNNETSVFSTLAVDPNWTGIVMPQAASSGPVRGVTDKYHAVYSISGSKISQPQKGTLYIRDGRKFIAR